MDSDLDLVSALRLPTKFRTRCIEHKKFIPNRNVLGLTEQSTQSGRSQNDNGSLVEIEETWDFEPGSRIGQGAFGTVMFQRRRPLMLDHTQTSHNQVRAVKEISKSGTPNYMKELQAIARFSQTRYNQFFVQSYGWFENRDSVFITMEYLHLGDLAGFYHREGPFPEKTVGLIIRQVLEGIKFMHEINFAHRDIKPGNILVVSTSPWRVKIADFGISKQYHESTQLQTQVGTLEYMAPEQKGQIKSSQKKIVYSTSVDIWAIGVITMELLLTHPFLYNSDQEDYVQGINPLSFEGPPSVKISEPCQDFVKGLLAPNPAHRPTAEFAISHLWFARVAILLKQDETLFVPEVNEPDPSQAEAAIVPSPMPLLSWSTFGNLHLSDGSLRQTLSARGTRVSRSSRRSLSTRGVTSNSVMETESFTPYKGRPFQRRLLAPCFRNLLLHKTKYFVLRSDNDTDMEISFANGMWTAMKEANTRLDNAYMRSGGNVVLFFSIVKSQKFCGVAKMTSAMDWNNTDDDWVPRVDGEEYQGRFTIEWICLNELPFGGIKNVPAYLGKQRRAIGVMDGTAICPESGYELLRAYSAIDRQSPCMIERRRQDA